MADDHRDFYTPTLAGLYERQGHLDRAAEVYRCLLEREPDRDDLRKALGRVEQKLFEGTRKTLEDTIPILCRWLELLTSYGNLTRFRKLEHRTSNLEP